MTDAAPHIDAAANGRRRGGAFLRGLLAGLLGLALLASPACAQQPDPLVNARPSPLTRAELYDVLDGYLAALAAQDPERVAWAARVRNTENNVAIMVGDGLWGTISELGDYDLRFADLALGQVGYFGTVSETEETSAYALRLKVEPDKTISEVESLILRQLDSGIVFEGQRFEDKPAMNEVLAPEERAARERMVSLADGYFDTLQQNDGTLFTRFSPDCLRIENGVRTTNNPDFPVGAAAALGCEEQFRLGAYRYDDRLRARRFPLIDEERGLILAGGFIDHSGRLAQYEMTDGRVVNAPLRRPHSFYLLELFKIKDDAIAQIESVFVTVPYNMPSPWDDWPDSWEE